MRAARDCGHRHFWPSQQRVSDRIDGGGGTSDSSSSCNRDWSEQSTRLLELLSTGRTAEAVVPYLGATARQGVLQEATHELHTRDRLAAELLAAVVAIAGISARYFPWILISRNPWKDGCLIDPSEVHSVNAASTTSFGYSGYSPLGPPQARLFRYAGLNILVSVS